MMFEILENEPAEQALDRLVKEYGILLHGSVKDIKDKCLRANEEGEIYATDRAPIAILKALFSNEGSTLNYSYFPDDEPMKLTIHKSNRCSEKPRGFVYLIEDTSSFRNVEMKGKPTWEYVSNAPTIPLAGRIEIERKDFQYPVVYQ